MATDTLEKRTVVAGARLLANTNPQSEKLSPQTRDGTGSNWFALSLKIQIGF